MQVLLPLKLLTRLGSRRWHLWSGLADELWLCRCVRRRLPLSSCLAGGGTLGADFGCKPVCHPSQSMVLDDCGGHVCVALPMCMRVTKAVLLAVRAKRTG